MEEISKEVTLRNLHLIMGIIEKYMERKTSILRLNSVVDGALNFIQFSNEESKQIAHEFWMDIESATCTENENPQLANDIADKATKNLGALLKKEIAFIESSTD